MRGVSPREWPKEIIEATLRTRDCWDPPEIPRLLIGAPAPHNAFGILFDRRKLLETRSAQRSVPGKSISKLNISKTWLERLHYLGCLSILGRRLKFCPFIYRRVFHWEKSSSSANFFSTFFNSSLMSPENAPVRLPVDALEERFRGALANGPVVVTSPTGSGKSTRVPTWCRGRTLVVEPRRVACRSLAQRVAELAGEPLGGAVGYQVRDEKRAANETRILFATPGIVLRLFDELLSSFDTVVLDELHERGLETDLLLALLKHRLDKDPNERQLSLVAMSATLDGQRVARHLGGEHLHAEGRLYPVETRYLPRSPLLPDRRGLESRVRQGIAASVDHEGDVLVFLPGKAEIRACAAALKQESGLNVVELHGGLNLEEQSRAFKPSTQRKVVLATNVAETSLTIPGIGVVIDSGLVRRTRYHQGRGFLTLGPIALDSADQRAGRAGRTGPGLAIRLWAEAARLEARTPPEIHREALASLVLGAAACGSDVDELVFLDTPKKHAVEMARTELQALDALDAEGRLTDSGRELFGLPLDAPLGRLLVEARKDPNVLDDVVDLVSILAGGRSLLRRDQPHAGDGDGEEEDGEEEDEIRSACDASVLLRAFREQPRRCQPEVRREALNLRRRLRRAFGLADEKPAPSGLDRRRLALALLAADPRSAYVARQRGRRLAFSNGGTEVDLGRRSAVAKLEKIEALVVLETRALGVGARDKKTLITAAMPVPLSWLLAAGLGRDRLAGVALKDGRVVARVERVHARRVLDIREEEPEGPLACDAMAELILAGRLFQGSLPEIEERLAVAGLAQQIIVQSEASKMPHWADEVDGLFSGDVPNTETWIRERLIALGVEQSDDLELLSASDLLPPALSEWAAGEIRKEYPSELVITGAAFAIRYDLRKRTALLAQVRGKPHQLPPQFALPRLPGLTIRIEHRGNVRTLREA